MSHYSEEVACQLLDDLVDDPNVARQARRRNWAAKLIWTWAHQSRLHKMEFDAGQRTESKYIVKWPTDDEGEGERRWFFEAMQLAFQLNAQNADLANRADLDGHKEPLFDPRTGYPVYKIDDALVAKYQGLDAGARLAAELNGVFDFPYCYEEGPDGQLRRVREYKVTPMAAALKSHTLRAIAGPTYDIADKSQVEQRVQGQVLIVGQEAPSQIDKRPTPMRQTLETKLAELRARGPQYSHPASPVPIGKPDDEPSPEADAKNGRPPRIPLTQHPRVYIADPITEAVKTVPKVPPYARPDERPADGGDVGYGPPHKGGFRTV